jgi:hypothetical protein
MKILKLFSLIALVFLLARCYPDGLSYAEETDIVVTNYDPAYNLAAKKTFALPAVIVKFDDEWIASGGPKNTVDPALAGPILNEIQKNMVDAGWTRVKAEDNPDVLLFPAAMESTVVVYDYWGYWGYWYGPYYPVVSVYKSGSVVVSMLDSKEKNTAGKPRIGWAFLLNGILEGSTNSVTNRFENSVDQAFKQSPYIQKK